MINHTLPKNWQIKTLGEVCEILDNMRKPINADEREQRLKKAENKFPYYGATGQVGYIDDYLCDFEAILLGEDGVPFLESMKNKAYIVSGKYWVNNHAHILKTKENIANNKFICHFLNILDYTPYVSGTTRLKLNQSSMKQIKIPLPPLEIQKAIVEKLENAFAHIDEAVRHLRAVQTNIPRLKSSLLHSAFNGKLTESPLCDSKPTSCHTEPLGEVSHIVDSSRDISLVLQAQYDNRDISHFSNAQYDKPTCHSEGEARRISLGKESPHNTIALTQKQIAFSQYPAFIYMVSNKNNTTLYIGVTSNLQKRIYEHKNHLAKGFSDKYNCEKLVYFESFDNINQAIEREKYLKGKKRAFKESLINSINPKWLDLYDVLFCYAESTSCHSEALAEESQKDSALRDISLVSQAQYDKGDNLPQGWEVKTLGEIGKVVSGGTPSTSNKDNFDGEIAWITPADLSGYKEKYISKGKRNLSEQGLKNSSARLLPPNSILFSSRAPIGYVAIASNALCTNQGFKNLIPNGNVSSEYIYYFLLHSKRLAESVASGTTFKEISAASFSKLPIPLPPLETQKQIVQILESKFAHLEKLAQFVNASLENLQRLKSSLLNQAFKGELIC